MAMTHRPRALLLAILAVLPAPAIAGQWTLTPNLMLAETYTDNVTLAPAGHAQGDFITQVDPGVFLVGSGPRYHADLNYVMQNLMYARTSGENRTYNLLNAQGNAELIPETFFVDANASVTQQATSLLNSLSLNNSNATANVTNTRTIGVSPYLVHDFGGAATGRLRLTEERSTYSGLGSLNSTSSAGDVLVNSGSDFVTTYWSADYHKDRIDYSATSQNVTFERYSGTLGHWLTSTFALEGTLGHENNNYVVSGPAPKGGFWRVGAHWVPSRRTDLAVSYGRRFFGKTYSLTFTHQGPVVLWNVSYGQDLATDQMQQRFAYAESSAAFLDAALKTQIPNDAQRAQYVQNYIAQNGLPLELSGAFLLLTDNVFLDKHFLASAGVTTAKTTATLSVFSLKQECQDCLGGAGAIASGDFLTSTNINQYGTSGTWTWQFLPRTSLIGNLEFARLQFPDLGRTDNLSVLRIGFSHVISPSMTSGLDFRHQQRNSSTASASYRENAITARLYMTF